MSGSGQECPDPEAWLQMRLMVLRPPQPFLDIDGLKAGGPNGLLHLSGGEGALLGHNPVDFCSHTTTHRKRERE